MISKEREEDEEEEKSHYVLIKEFDRFMFNKNKHKEKKHFCYRCLQCFSGQQILDKHIENCIEINGIQGIEMPSEEHNILRFKNHYKQQPVPFVIYADFEAITKKVEGCEQSDTTSYIIYKNISKT